MADMEAIKQALAQVTALVNEADTSAIAAKRAPPPGDASAPEGAADDGSAGCPDCAAGDCVVHPKPEDIDALSASLGE